MHDAWLRKMTLSPCIRRCENRDHERQPFFRYVSCSLLFHVFIGLILIFTIPRSACTPDLDNGENIIRVSLVGVQDGFRQQTSFPGSSESSKASESKGVKAVEQERRPEIQKVQAVNLSTERLHGSSDHTFQRTGSIQSAYGARLLLGGREAKETVGLDGKKIAGAIPRYRYNSNPPYPMLARERGYEGLVLVSVQVLSDGSVGERRLKKSSGHSILDKSALDSIKAWQFEPGKYKGFPVTMWVEVPIKFALVRD